MRTIPTIPITAEQYSYALKLTELSATAHKTANVWDRQGGAKNSLKMRFTGLLGEVVFADLFGLPRPAKAYGATDGQDYGSDFCIKGTHIDIKTMRREHGRLKPNFVFNLAPAQVLREDSKTNLYAFVNIYGDIESGTMYAQMAGKMERKTVIGYRDLCTISQATRADSTPIELRSPVIAIPVSLMQDFRLPPTYAGAVEYLKIQNV
jgi:hypothetical protein